MEDYSLPDRGEGTLRDAYTNKLICGGNTVSAHINSNKEGTFEKTDRCSAYYSLFDWTVYEDEIWVMDPIWARANRYQEQTKSTTVGANHTKTVDFYLLPYSR